MWATGALMAVQDARAFHLVWPIPTLAIIQTIYSIQLYAFFHSIVYPRVR